MKQIKRLLVIALTFSLLVACVPTPTEKESVNLDVVENAAQQIWNTRNQLADNFVNAAMNGIGTSATYTTEIHDYGSGDEVRMVTVQFDTEYADMHTNVRYLQNSGMYDIKIVNGRGVLHIEMNER